MNKIKSLLLKIMAICLVLVLSLPVNASTFDDDSISPRASYYLTAYNTYICDLGNGEIQIWYEVMGTGFMDEIGVLTIYLYEVNSDGSLTWVETFLYEDYDTMLFYNDNYIFSYVSYQGLSSKTYKTYVCIWAGKDGSGDTRYMWARE